MRKVISSPFALILTFIACGFLHDIFYLIPMAIMDDGKIPLPFVTTWFLLISVGVILAEFTRADFRKIRPGIRPVLHLGFLAMTFSATVFLSAKW